LALRHADAKPVGDEPMMAEGQINIEKPLKFALRVKVGAHPESMIFMYYLNIPFKLCTHCYRLGHMIESCVVYHGRPLEDVYDQNIMSEPDEEESQSLVSELIILIGYKINQDLLSEPAMASPVNNSHISVLNGEDIYLDDVSSH
ncbi:hypothetical protein MKX01_037802, partial [Papaver californicum]